MNSDFRSPLSTFNDHKVRYLVVGGYAVMKYSEPRYTKDLDVWAEATPANARTVFAALREFGAPLTGITETDFAREGCIYQMGRPPVRVDVMTSIDGVQFADAWTKRLESDFGGTPANVISRADLIANKQVTGRPQDRIDVESLLASEWVANLPKRRVRRPKRKDQGGK